jgi:hypothetical protein
MRSVRPRCAAGIDVGADGRSEGLSSTIFKIFLELDTSVSGRRKSTEKTSSVI